MHEQRVVEVDPKRQLLLVAHLRRVNIGQLLHQHAKLGKRIGNVSELLLANREPGDLEGSAVRADVRPRQLPHGLVRVRAAVAPDGILQEAHHHHRRRGGIRVAVRGLRGGG